MTGDLDWPRPEVTPDRSWVAGDYPAWLRAWAPHGVSLTDHGVAITKDDHELAVLGTAMLLVAAAWAVPGVAFGLALLREVALEGIGAAVLFVSLYWVLALLFLWFGVRLWMLRGKDAPALLVDDEGLHLTGVMVLATAHVAWADLEGVSWIYNDGAKGMIVHARAVTYRRRGLGRVLGALAEAVRRADSRRLTVLRTAVVPSLMDVEAVIASHRRAPVVPDATPPDLSRRFQQEAAWWQEAERLGTFERPPSWRAAWERARVARYATPPPYRWAMLTAWRRRYLSGISFVGAFSLFFASMAFWPDMDRPGPPVRSTIVVCLLPVAATLLNLWLSRRPARAGTMRRLVRSYGRNLQLRLCIALLSLTAPAASGFLDGEAAAPLTVLLCLGPVMLAAPTLRNARRRSSTVPGTAGDELLGAVSSPGYEWAW